MSGDRGFSDPRRRPMGGSVKIDQPVKHVEAPLDVDEAPRCTARVLNWHCGRLRLHCSPLGVAGWLAVLQSALCHSTAVCAAEALSSREGKDCGALRFETIYTTLRAVPSAGDVVEPRRTLAVVVMALVASSLSVGVVAHGASATGRRATPTASAPMFAGFRRVNGAPAVLTRDVEANSMVSLQVRARATLFFVELPSLLLFQCPCLSSAGGILVAIFVLSIQVG